MTEPERRPILRSQRSYLRPAERQDIPLLAEWMNDSDVMETLGGRGPISEVAEESWFEDLQKEQGKTRWHFVICLRDGGRPIGVIALESVNLLDGAAKLGIGICERSWWDQGFGTEATRVILDFGFGELRLHRIFVDVFDGNDRARRLCEKLGFVHEGTQREALFRHGRYLDIHSMGILRDEWSAQGAARVWDIE